MEIRCSVRPSAARSSPRTTPSQKSQDDEPAGESAEKAGDQEPAGESAEKAGDQEPAGEEPDDEEAEAPSEDERLEEVTEAIDEARSQPEDAGVLVEGDGETFVESGAAEEKDDQTIAPPG